MNSISIVGLVFTLPILSVVYWVWISPRIFFRVAGEQSGNPICVKRNARIPFAVSTRSSGYVNIINVSVYFDDNQINLFKTLGVQKEMSTDRVFPMAIIFPEKKEVKKYTLQSNYFDVQEKVDNFSVKLVAVAEPDHSRLPFWLSILPARTVRKEKIIHFRVDLNLQEDMRKQGLLLKPRESIQIIGVQSQSEMSAVADKGTVAVDVREILND